MPKTTVGASSSMLIKCDSNGLRVGLSDQAFATNFRTYFPTAQVLRTVADVAQCDLIIFPGGADIDPKYYGEQDSALCYTDTFRDEIELALFKEADKLGKKMYGSCRGHQLFNVGRGGTLHQDLRTIGRAHEGGHALHWTGERGTKIREIFKGRVNSLHHQGISRIGKGIAVLADFNGIAELIVSKNLLGTQFHPELMDYKTVKPFFDLLIEWAKYEEPETTTEEVEHPATA
jgi:putative glutamine amidotransferase